MNNDQKTMLKFVMSIAASNSEFFVADWQTLREFINEETPKFRSILEGYFDSPGFENEFGKNVLNSEIIPILELDANVYIKHLPESPIERVIKSFKNMLMENMEEYERTLSDYHTDYVDVKSSSYWFSKNIRSIKDLPYHLEDIQDLLADEDIIMSQMEVLAKLEEMYSFTLEGHAIQTPEARRKEQPKKIKKQIESYIDHLKDDPQFITEFLHWTEDQKITEAEVLAVMFPHLNQGE